MVCAKNMSTILGSIANMDGDVLVIDHLASKKFVNLTSCNMLRLNVNVDF